MNLEETIEIPIKDTLHDIKKKELKLSLITYPKH